MLSRRAFFASIALSVLPAGSRIARAQTYPTRPVRIIVGFPAGVAADAIARLIAQSLSESLRQQFVVENRPGAGSNIATDAGRARHTRWLFAPPAHADKCDQCNDLRESRVRFCPRY